MELMIKETLILVRSTNRVWCRLAPLLGCDGARNAIEISQSDKLGSLVQGPAIAEDEIHRAGDVTVLEVMATAVIIQGVLVRVEPAVEERRLVATDAQRHRLLRHSSGPLRRCSILERPIQSNKQCQHSITRIE